MEDGTLKEPVGLVLDAFRGYFGKKVEVHNAKHPLLKWIMIRPPKIWQNGILCHIWHIQILILVINRWHIVSYLAYSNLDSGHKMFCAHCEPFRGGRNDS